MHADDRFLTTCRCCLSNKGQFKDMTTEVLALNFKSDLSLIDVFKQCTGVEFDELLTTKICLSCEFKLQMCYEFKEMCKASDLVLKQDLKNEEVFNTALEGRIRTGGVVSKKSRTPTAKNVQNDKMPKRVHTESNLKLVRKNGVVANHQMNNKKRLVASPFDMIPTSTGSESQPKSESDDSSTSEDEVFSQFLKHRAGNKKILDEPRVAGITNQTKPREQTLRHKPNALDIRQLCSVAEVTEFDERLGRDTKFRDNVLTQFNRIGGQTPHDHIRNVVRNLFTNQVLECFTWYKWPGDKIPFNKFQNICNVICKSVESGAGVYFTSQDLGKVMVIYLENYRSLE